MFCKSCGSRLWNYGKQNNNSIKDAPFANVTASSVVGGVPFKPGAHINTAEQADWVEINDDLDNFSGIPAEEYFIKKAQEYLANH